MFLHKQCYVFIYKQPEIIRKRYDGFGTERNMLDMFQVDDGGIANFKEWEFQQLFFDGIKAIFDNKRWLD